MDTQVWPFSGRENMATLLFYTETRARKWTQFRGHFSQRFSKNASLRNQTTSTTRRQKPRGNGPTSWSPKLALTDQCFLRTPTKHAYGLEAKTLTGYIAVPSGIQSCQNKEKERRAQLSLRRAGVTLLATVCDDETFQKLLPSAKAEPHAGVAEDVVAGPQLRPRKLPFVATG